MNPEDATPRSPSVLARALVVALAFAVTVGVVAVLARSSNLFETAVADGAVLRAPDEHARSVTVEPAGGVRLELHLPAGRGPHPVLFYVHGGGWSGGEPSDFPPTFGIHDAIERGWAVASVGYRLVDLPAGITARDQVADVAAALEWIGTRGTDLALGDHLVGIGHSAGAHLLAVTASTAPEHHRPDAVILVGGVYDFAPDIIEHRVLGPAALAAHGCASPDCVLDPALDAGRFAAPGVPPVAIIHGTDDPVVEPGTAVRYADALSAAGVEVALHVVEHGDHGGDEIGAMTQFVFGLWPPAQPGDTASSR